jgi:lysophospholipase L1-like esterase
MAYYTKQNFVDFGDPLTAAQLIKMEDSIVSKWYGKKISILGDSILYGVGLNDRVKENISTLLQNMTGAIVTNYGISGTKVSGTASNSFCKRFPDVSKGADLTIVFGGTNDYWHKSTNIGETTSTDINTFCGAINNIIDYHCKNNGTSELLFVFPFSQAYNGTSCETNHGYGTFAQFRDAMKTICARRGIPFLDLYSESGMDVANNATHKSLFTTDGVHAKPAGHKRVAERMFSKIEYGM